MKDKSIGAGIILMLIMLAVTPFLAGCGNFWKAPNTTGGTTTTTDLTSSASSVAIGASVTLTATVTASSGTTTPTGTVTFYNGTTSLGTGTLSSGTATLTTSFTTAATDSIKATYGGSTTFAVSTSTAVTITVTSSSSSTATTTTLSPSTTTPTTSESVTLTATVAPSAATGTVTFYDGTTALGAGPVTLSSGTATLATSFSTAGTYSLTATYSGDSTYATSTSSVVSITVSAAVAATACGLQDSTNSVNATAANAYSSGTTTLSGANATILVSAADESAICAENTGTTLTVTSPAITSSSVGSNLSDSSYFGTNAAVLAYGSSPTSPTGASITMTGGGTIGTSGQYSNGVFASGDGASISLNGVSITTSGANAHAADAAEDGTLNLTNVSATTSGQNSPAIATDQGGGTVTVTYGILTAQNAEAVAVDGSGSITLTGTTLSSTMGNYRGILLYQDTSGAGATSFTMTGGSISYTCPVTASSTTCSSGVSASRQNTNAAVFSVANTSATISLTDVTVINNTSTTTDSSGTLLTAQAFSLWGASGSNGGNVTFTAKGETLTGDVIVDPISTIALTLNEDSATTPVPSTLTGAINNAKSAGTVSLTLDSASSWTVTNTSYLTSLTGLVISGSNVVSNIVGGGHCVYYSGNINGASSTTTYTLSGASVGYLAPTGTTGLTCL